MQKIIIKNFGAIEFAEVEIPKLLILIGEQASGKSTISKLIYFFKSLRDDLFSLLYTNTIKENSTITSELSILLREKFYDFFGSTNHLKPFNIQFLFSVNKFITISLTDSKRLVVNLSDNFFNLDSENEISRIRCLLQVISKDNQSINEQLINQQEKFKIAQQLSLFVNNLFESNQADHLYVIAGRNATISYSDLFEKYLLLDSQNQSIENIKQNLNNSQNNRSTQTIDQTLMVKFMERVLKLKNLFKKFAGFHGLLETHSKNNENEQAELIKNIETILKGKYKIDESGEKIEFTNGEFVHLQNASSGQQEAIRILQDIFMIILQNNKVLRIFEEPEAHLFPVAQKQMIELLALMLGMNADNQLIITTHSPYVLTIINNLLFANRVVEKNKEVKSAVEEIISEKYWLKGSDVAVYSLEKSNSGHLCTSILNKDTNLIAQNYLDTVSEMLNNDFNSLYAIHSQLFKRK